MSLLQMSFSGAVLILAVVLLRAVAIHKLPKRIFPVLWGIVLARLLLPMSLWTLPLPTSAGGYTPTLDAVEQGITAVTFGAFSDGPLDLESGAVQATQTSVPSIPLLPLIWLAGAALLAAVFLISWLRCRREFRTSLPVRNEITAQWLRAHPLRRTVDIRQLTGLSTPLTYGIFRPVILTPGDTDWEDSRQAAYMLYHEYVHIRRFDAVGKLAASAALCVHWFNPLVWVLYLLFNRDVELACDEAVVHRFGGEDRAAYARALIGMEARRSGFAPFHSHFAKNAIEERIESIMRVPKKSVFALALVIVLMAVGTVTAFAAAPEAKEKVISPIRTEHNSRTEIIYYLVGELDRRTVFPH